MPYCKTYTETVVAVTVPIVVVEVEWTCVRIVIVASTFEEWIIVAVVNTDKVRVRYRYIPAFRSSYARTKSAYYLILLFLLCLLLCFLHCSDNRYHITVLQDIHGNCRCCNRSHCCCWSRMNLWKNCYSCLHVRRRDNRCCSQNRQS